MAVDAPSSEASLLKMEESRSLATVSISVSSKSLGYCCVCGFRETGCYSTCTSQGSGCGFGSGEGERFLFLMLTALLLGAMLEDIVCKMCNFFDVL